MRLVLLSTAIPTAFTAYGNGIQAKNSRRLYKIKLKWIFKSNSAVGRN
jgi:hypothetical protein